LLRRRSVGLAFIVEGVGVVIIRHKIVPGKFDRDCPRLETKVKIQGEAEKMRAERKRAKFESKQQKTKPESHTLTRVDRRSDIGDEKKVKRFSGEEQIQKICAKS
jgi:hypothetical protein